MVKTKLQTDKMIRVRVGDFRLRKEEKQAINDVLDSGHISEGQKVREFEKKWAEFVGTRYAIALSSGTASLIAGLTALKICKNFKNRPKVITTPITYISTVNAIVLSGYEPVFVDVDKATFGITPETIKAHLKTAKDCQAYSIVLPVHLMGYPVDMVEINKVADQYNLITFEDSAQAHGSLIEGKKAGSMAAISIFSFYIAHNIQAGEMGALNTSDGEISRLVRKLKTNGRMCDCPICLRSKGKCPRLKNYKGDDDFDPRFTHDLIGYNFKTMEFQAVLALTQLNKIDFIIKKRQENVKYLNEQLEEYSDILQLPPYSDNVSYLAYPLVIKSKISRRKLRMELEKHGVETRPLYGCIPTQQPAYAYLRDTYKNKLPNADYLGKKGFYIGCHQYLEQEDLNYIVTVFHKILKRL
ncbi:DegT/DnrJ/EryC1/StrS aminotransferase family protein [bacterium]|nr:DegT/DnrJ/EryC1/StrS aminotransferase family protein [bacterium]